MKKGHGADGDSTALSDPGNLYRLLVESARDYAIFALDTAGRVLSWKTAPSTSRATRETRSSGVISLPSIRPKTLPRANRTAS